MNKALLTLAIVAVILAAMYVAEALCDRYRPATGSALDWRNREAHAGAAVA
jgi:hypothetical protein